MFAYSLYKIGEFLANSLPLKTAYKLAIFVSDLHYMVAFKDRANVKANLKVILPEKTDKQICSIRLQMFRNFAKYLVDFFRFSKIDSDYIKNSIKVHNFDCFKKAFSTKSPVILLTAHLGNWELGGVVINELGFPLAAVALPHKSVYVDNFFNQRRNSKGIQIIPLGKAARMCIEVLKQKKLLALLGDRDFSKENGVLVSFFGKKAYLPKGPAFLASRYNAVIIPAFLLRNLDDNFELFIEEPILCHAGETLENLINRYKDIFEIYIKKYPDQWFMFNKFWIG